MIPKTTRVLMLMVVPGHLLFMLIIHLFEAGHTTMTIQFTLIYLTAALIQVI
jgi:solute carrier family 41